MLDVDTFLTIVYVTVDEFDQTQLPLEAPQPGPAPSLCRSEVVTLALFSQWAPFPSERAFYRYASRHLRPAFPRLPARSQFNRLLRHHQPAITAFALHLAEQLGASQAPYEILDSTALPIRNAKRRGRSWLVGSADIGYSPRIGWFYGFRLLAAVTPTGVITGFGFGPASADDLPLAETLFALRAQPDPHLPSAGRPASGQYVADTGFSGLRWEARWLRDFGVQVVCSPQRTSHRRWPKRVRRWVAGRRQVIETVIDRLLEPWGLRQERPHELSGLQARLAAKVALHNVCCWLNQQLGRPLLAVADLLDW